MTTPPRRIHPDAAKRAEAGFDVTQGQHGTAYTPGQTSVEGSAEAGINRSTFDISDPDRAYYTAASKHYPEGTELAAWGWAGSAARSRGEPTLPNGGQIFGRPVVHDVQAHGLIDLDRNMETQYDEFTADKLSITGSHWIRHPYDNEIGVQGTLPHMNWNQFADPNLARGMDLNNAGIDEETRQMKGSKEHDQAVMSRKLTVQNFGRTSPARGLRGVPGEQFGPEKKPKRAPSTDPTLF